MEKIVDAHNGAALCARWNSDGTGLLTCKCMAFSWKVIGQNHSLMKQNLFNESQ